MTGPTIDAAEWFADRCAYSYDPATETEADGRARTGRELAAAEREATSLGWFTEWADDWDLGISHADYYCSEAYPDGNPSTCERASLFTADGSYLTGLGCIDDASPEYRRVVEAELALEALREAGFTPTGGWAIP